MMCTYFPPSQPQPLPYPQAVAQGHIKVEESPLRHAPHTIDTVLAPEWKKPYSREQAAFPAPWVKANKFWPTVGRLDNVYGRYALF